MPQVEGCRLITGRRVPAKPLLSPWKCGRLLLSSIRHNLARAPRITCGNSSCTPRSKVQALSRLKSVSAVQPHDQRTLDLSVVTEVSGLCDLSVLSVHRTQVHLVPGVHRRRRAPACRLGPARQPATAAPARTTWHTTTGSHQRPPGGRGRDAVPRPRADRHDNVPHDQLSSREPHRSGLFVRR